MWFTNSFTILLPYLLGSFKDGRLLYIVDDYPRRHNYKILTPPPPPPNSSPPLPPQLPPYLSPPPPPDSCY